MSMSHVNTSGVNFESQEVSTNDSFLIPLGELIATLEEILISSRNVIIRPRVLAVRLIE